MINIQNIDDNEYFKWCLVKYLYPKDLEPARIRKLTRLFRDEIDFGDIKFPVKIKDIRQIKKKHKIGISVFSYENEVKKKKCF